MSCRASGCRCWKVFEESEYLQLSGLQHFAFCRRQWALIHIEQQWRENIRTVEGDILHERVHTEGLAEKRGDLLSIRGLRVCSAKLGVSGCCDLVEFTASEAGAYLNGRTGKWLPTPVEYKRGAPKANDADRLQLCCQAMCLEEMLCCDIAYGCIYYGETRHRERIALTEDLRARVVSMLAEMHQYFSRGYTPRGKRRKGCNACSMKEICLPTLGEPGAVRSYLTSHLTEDGDEEDS